MAAPPPATTNASGRKSRVHDPYKPLTTCASPPTHYDRLTSSPGPGRGYLASTPTPTHAHHDASGSRLVDGSLSLSLGRRHHPLTPATRQHPTRSPGTQFHQPRHTAPHHHHQQQRQQRLTPSHAPSPLTVASGPNTPPMMLIVKGADGQQHQMPALPHPSSGSLPPAARRESSASAADIAADTQAACLPPPAVSSIPRRLDFPPDVTPKRPHSALEPATEPSRRGSGAATAPALPSSAVRGSDVTASSAVDDGADTQVTPTLRTVSSLAAEAMEAIRHSRLSPPNNMGKVHDAQQRLLQRMRDEPVLFDDDEAPLLPEQRNPSPTLVSKRRKQIEIGLLQPEYTRYRELVPKHRRQRHNPNHPVTPRADCLVACRKFKNLVRDWRCVLHLYGDVNFQGGSPHGAAAAVDAPHDEPGLDDMGDVDGAVTPDRTQRLVAPDDEMDVGVCLPPTVVTTSADVDDDVLGLAPRTPVRQATSTPRHQLLPAQQASLTPSTVRPTPVKAGRSPVSMTTAPGFVTDSRGGSSMASPAKPPLRPLLLSDDDADEDIAPRR